MKTPGQKLYEQFMKDDETDGWNTADYGPKRSFGGMNEHEADCLREYVAHLGREEILVYEQGGMWFVEWRDEHA